MSPARPLLQDLTYERFVANSSQPDFLEQLTHISGFTYIAETNLLGGWSEDKDRRVIFRLQSTIQEALKLSGFHNQVALTTRRFSDGVEFSYDDPDFEFTYFLDGAGRIVLTRRGSTIRQFHEWYRRFMPSLPALIMDSVNTMNEELTGFDKEEVEDQRESGANWRPVIKVERASYNFDLVIAIKLDSIPERPGLLNVEILNESLLRRVPAGNGSLVDPKSLDPDEFGLVTYQVNRWADSGHAYEMYRVTGPSNNNWGNLYFYFSYAGDTYVPSEGERRPFEQDEFVTVRRTTDAYLDFFRNRAACGFVLGVLRPEGASPDLDSPSTRAEYSTRSSA
jgi:hypothetical protein